jgi:hypothetical protein
MSTTEAENKAQIRRIYEEMFNQGNLVIADELIAPDFFNHATPPAFPLWTRIVGTLAAIPFAAHALLWLPSSLGTTCLHRLCSAHSHNRGLDDHGSESLTIVTTLAFMRP